MENTEIARIFHEIAELLEMKGEDHFRIRSYRNAAMVIEGLTESLKTLYEKGEAGLDGIPGVGKGIRAKIAEMLTTGRCAVHDGLLKELPAGLFDVLKVGGIGPKKVMLLYKELGITSVDALRRAAESHAIHALPGMGEKTEENIIRAVESLKKVSARFNLAVGLSYAEGIKAHLQKTPGVARVEAAGSLRRWKDSIGDLDMLCIAHKPEDAIAAFAAYPGVKDVLSKGGTKSTVVLKTGLQVDLRVLKEDAFGAAMQYFTGSKAHNVALRDMAKRKGLKINEYGVFKEPGDRWDAGKTEEDVYRSVGLPWIPPELRENRGEIEAAAEGRLPAPLELCDIRGDLHVHTRESDGNATLAELSEAAQARGYEYIAITDHSRAVGVAHGLDEKRAMAQIEAIDAFNERLKASGRHFRLLKGAEVDIRADGTLDHADEVLSRLDCVVGAVHSGFNMTREAMTGRIIKGMESGWINVLAHPTGRLIGVREPYKVDMEAVMGAAKRHGTALELNSYPERLDLNDVHCRMARERGILVAVSTDSHSTAHLGNITFGIHNARRGWLEKNDVLNTRGLKELLRILKKTRQAGR
ncbi:MAG: DNA polymerase/3'-5' exonuclease PolX [Deltaproteobacteria bacterium]|nr:DNA polymerase/3'-5' exonuclease PolX [Deltaproteobacteria bacterium]